MEWIKCSELMPEDGIKVLMFNGNIIVSGCYRDKTNDWDTDLNDGVFDFAVVTHWMQLPPEPK